jgi:hypothetical protein
MYVYQQHKQIKKRWEVSRLSLLNARFAVKASDRDNFIVIIYL